jgi:hypothetical protein
VAAAQHAVQRLEQAEALGRAAIAEEQASGLDVAAVVEQLRGLVARSAAQAQEALAARAEASGEAAVAAEAGEGAAGAEAAAAQLALEEERQRWAVSQGEQEAVAELLHRQTELLRAVAVVRSERLEVEQQETAARLALAEEQWASAMALGAQLPSVLVGRLAEAQSMAQASRERMEESLEERQAAPSQLSRPRRHRGVWLCVCITPLPAPHLRGVQLGTGGDRWVVWLWLCPLFFCLTFSSHASLPFCTSCRGDMQLA